MSVLRRLGGAAGAVFGAALVASMLPASTAQALTSYIETGMSVSYVVDNTSLSCSDTGPGNAAQPFCTIAAAAAKAQPGNTILVNAGTYSGTGVDPKNSGGAGSPITFTANPGVTIKGGTRAFSISGRSYITINGFSVIGTSSYGIYVSGGSNNILSNNSVSTAGVPVSGSTVAGIYIDNLAGGTVSGNVSYDNSSHGIALVGTTTGVMVTGNTAYNNADQYQRAAEGIEDLSPGNSIIGNYTYGNEDSGISIYPGANDTLVADNVSYDNGDHGIDNHDVTGGHVIGNTVYYNCTDGINVEGTSANYDVENNIAMDNATGAIINPTPINPPGAYVNNCQRHTGNIGVYDSAPATTTANYNLVWQDGPGVEYEWGGHAYSSESALNTATGQEANGLFANPMFVHPAAWNLQLTAGSPAIDSANSGATGEQLTDILGNPRVDVPGVPNTGAGPRAYDDRGAYEFQPIAPAPQLTVTPASGTVPLAVTADASGSTPGNSAITGYKFDFGDGSVVGPQAGATATHTYSGFGTYAVRVTVTDRDGLSATATQSVTVNPQPPTAQLTVSPGSGIVPLGVTADASGSTPGSSPITGYTFDFGDGTIVGPQAGGTATHTYGTAGTYTVTVTVTDEDGTTVTASKSVTVTSAPTAKLTVSPGSGIVPLGVTADASESTPGSSPITGYTFDFGDGTIVGPQAGPTATHTYAAVGTYAVKVTVTNKDGLAGIATQSVTVSPQVPPTASLTVSPASGTVPLGVTADASGSSQGSSPITGYTFDFGDGTTVGPEAGATASHTFTAVATYAVKVTVTDKDGLTATSTKSVTVWPVARYMGQIGTGHATTKHNSDSVTVPRTRHVAAGNLIVVAVQLTGTSARGAVTGIDSAGDHLRTVSSIYNRGDRLVVLAGVAKHGLTRGNKITIKFPSAKTNSVTADAVAGVTTLDRQAAAAGTSASFSSKSTGPISRPGEFVFAVTAAFGKTSVKWKAGWTTLGTYSVGSNALARAYRIPMATASYAGTGTAKARWLAMVVAFK